MHRALVTTVPLACNHHFQISSTNHKSSLNNFTSKLPPLVDQEFHSKYTKFFLIASSESQAYHHQASSSIVVDSKDWNSLKAPSSLE
jgi:hypothetical protein